MKIFLLCTLIGVGLGFLRPVSDLFFVPQTIGFLFLAATVSLYGWRRLLRMSERVRGRSQLWVRLAAVCFSLCLFVLSSIGIVWCELRSVYSFQDFTYHVPAQLEDGWETAAMSAEGLNEIAITGVLQGVHREEYGSMFSILLVKNGKLVLESYHRMNGRDKPQYLRSATKSIASLLIGIAKDQGSITSVDAPIFEYLPQEMKDWQRMDRDSPTLKDVLTMTSGYLWKESGGYHLWDLTNDSIWLLYTPRPFRFVLSRPIQYPPGTHFQYNTGNSLLLSAVLSGTTGMDAATFAAQHLFDPLGMVGYGWFWPRDGFPHTGGGLTLRARDMAKIGQLLLDDGLYQGKRIVSSEWIHDSIEPTQIHPRYGYQWWLTDFPSEGRTIPVIYAAGDGGQMIYVIPEWQTVMVLTTSMLGVASGDADRVAKDLASAMGGQ